MLSNFLEMVCFKAFNTLFFKQANDFPSRFSIEGRSVGGVECSSTINKSLLISVFSKLYMISEEVSIFFLVCEKATYFSLGEWTLFC